MMTSTSSKTSTKFQASKNLIKNLRKGSDGWRIKTSKRIQSKWKELHRQQYENSEIVDSLISCTRWDCGNYQNTCGNVFDINFEEWLQQAKERELFIGLAQGVVEGVIRMVFSGAKVNLQMSGYNSTMRGIDAISGDVSVTQELKTNCDIVGHHRIVTRCASHQVLTKLVQRLTNKAVCCNCTTEQMEADETIRDAQTSILTTPPTMGDVPTTNPTTELDRNEESKTKPPIKHDKNISAQTPTASSYTDETDTKSEYPRTTTTASKMTEGNVRKLSRKDAGISAAKILIEPPSLQDNSTEETSYISGTEPASHNITAVPESESSFPLDPLTPRNPPIVKSSTDL